MSKKPHSTESFATYALAVMAVTFTVVGAMGVSAINADGSRAPTYESASQDYKPSQHGLFDAAAFRKAIRDRAALRAGKISDRSTHSDTAAEDRAVDSPEVSTTDSTVSDEVTDAAVEKPLRVTDLTSGQRRDLRHFLRIRACPTLVETRVDPEKPAIKAFRKLCEKMLDRQERRETLRGAANPHQNQ